MKLCCFNIKFNRKYYFLILLGALCLWNWKIKYDLIVGIIFGLIQSTLMKNKKSCLQSRHYTYLEGLCNRIGLTNNNNWIRLKDYQSIESICTKDVYSDLES
jgi:hypothetical protein